MTTEHIEKELKLAQANILAAQERMDAIVKEMAESKPAVVEEWPKKGYTVWRAEYAEEALPEKWIGTLGQKHAMGLGLVKRTREEAEAKSKWLSNPRTEARFRLEQLEGFDVNGGWIVVIDVNCRLEIWEYPVNIKTGGIRFTTEARAQYAKTHHADDLMLVLKGEVQS